MPSQALDRRQLLVGALSGVLVTTFDPAPARAGGRALPLFVITRSTNANVVHYDARLRESGSVNPEDPISAYWVMKAKDGRREGLTWLERHFAYGYSVVGSVAPEGFRMRLTAFEKREIAVVRRARESYHARVPMHGQPATLERIHVQTAESGVTPRVLYVNLFGRKLGDGHRISERLRA